MSSIYQLTDDYQRLFDDIAAAIEDGDEPSLDAALAALELQDNIKDKVINIGKYLKNISGSIDGLSKEIARLNARKKSLQRQDERLKAASLAALQMLGIERIDDDIMPVRIQSNSAWSVQIENVERLPEQYRQVEYKADKRKLIADKDQLQLDGVQFIKGSHVRFG